MSKTWDIIKLIQWGTNYLDQKGIESSRLNIELLICKVLKCDRLFLYTHFDKPLVDEELKVLKELIKKRVEHYPLQYLLGSVNFHGFEFKINESALIPRPETEELVEFIINDNKELKNKELSILDIGTGSGCIAITLSKHFINAKVIGLDISDKALELAKENAINLSVNNVKFHLTDILNSVPKRKYDIIVSNPPYVSNKEKLELKPELSFEPEIALTDYEDGLKFYKRFASILPQILKDSSSKFYFELGSETYQSIDVLFDKRNYKTEILEDFNKNKRYLKGKLVYNDNISDTL